MSSALPPVQTAGQLAHVLRQSQSQLASTAKTQYRDEFSPPVGRMLAVLDPSVSVDQVIDRFEELDASMPADQAIAQVHAALGPRMGLIRGTHLGMTVAFPLGTVATVALGAAALAEAMGFPTRLEDAGQWATVGALYSGIGLVLHRTAGAPVSAVDTVMEAAQKLSQGEQPA